jgi:predicted SprT family Zn-dependent metalloprotease
MENAITMSDNYRSGFMIRVKKTNGKTNSVWLELSSHNEKLATTVEELQKLVKDMSLEEDVRFSEKAVAPIPKVYGCTVCGYTMPAFPEHPQVGRYYCPSCNKWLNFQKR